MANGATGRPRAYAARLVEEASKGTGGGATVPVLDQGACSALARQPRGKNATFRIVQVGKCATCDCEMK